MFRYIHNDEDAPGQSLIGKQGRPTEARHHRILRSIPKSTEPRSILGHPSSCRRHRLRSTSSRLSVETHVDPTGKRKNTAANPFGRWLEDPGLFDRSFFSISPREAPQMDPAQRLALMCAYEALEMAGIVPDAASSTSRSRVGVYIGCTSNDWCETNSAQDIDFYFVSSPRPIVLSLG
jgi:hypothetical protein